MLQVKTKIDKSKTHGIGLFAAEFIPKGTATWQHDAKFDMSYPLKSIGKMKLDQKSRFLDYAYLDFKIKKYVLCCDDQRFINHSNNPNIKSTPTKDIAKRDISVGEELTCNYEEYEKGWFKRRGLKKGSFKPRLK